MIGLPVPFTPIQVLWVNLIADGPPAMTLGVDQPAPGVMDRPPVSTSASILSLRRIARLVFIGLVMAGCTLGLFVWGRDTYTEDIALTMAFTTFVLQQMFNVFNARTETESVFSRYSLTNWRLWAVVAGVIALQVLASSWSLMQSLFGTEHLTWAQWGACAAVASMVLWLEELRKLGARLIARFTPAVAASPPARVEVAPLSTEGMN